MQKEVLDNAIQLGQLLKLLTPLANGSKSFSKRLGRLRSGVEEQVILAIAAPDADVARRAQTRIGEVGEALLGSMRRHLDIPTLLSESRTKREVYSGSVSRAEGRHGWDNALFSDAEAVMLEPTPETPIPDSERARVLRAYTSAVKNSTWLSTLLRLKLSLRAANAENTYLTNEHGSNQGRDALAETLLKLCPAVQPPPDAAAPAKVGARATRSRRKKVAVKAAGLYTVQVTFQPETLLAQRDLAALASVTFKGDEPAPTLAQLLETATKPVAVGEGETPEAVAQRIVDELVVALVARNKAAEDEKAALRKKAEEAAKGAAVDALKQLDPNLLKVLKGNPELLQNV